MNPHYLLLPVANAFVSIDSYQIMRAEADDVYTKIFLTNGKSIIVSWTLKKLEHLLSECNNSIFSFCRIHRKHLINLSYVRQIINKRKFVVMMDGSKISISKRKKHLLLSNFIGENNSFILLT